MKERGTTGAGRPQITGVPRVHRHLLGRTSEIHPLTPRAVIHGSVVTNGAKLFHHWTKSRLGWRQACWNPARAKPKKTSHVGRWRQQKGPDEPLRDAMLTAIPQARALRGVPERTYSAQVVEAWDEEDEGERLLEENEASEDEFLAEYQEAVSMMAIAKQRRTEVDRARQFIFRKPQSSEERKAQDRGTPRGAEARALDEGVWVTPENVEGIMEACSSKLVDELCTVSCVSGNSNSVDLPQIFLGESKESLLHIFGPENLTCVADVCSYVPN